jgi:hypothetical protein
MKSQAPRLLIVAVVWFSFWVPGPAQQDWPPSDLRRYRVALRVPLSRFRRNIVEQSRIVEARSSI